MTQDELLRRRPLWEAMSDLFLDTEVRWSVPYVARRCAESGWDDEALERIFWVEVFPEAIGNLLQPAGEWGALSLDETSLVRRANFGTVPWLSRRAHGWMVEKPWLAAREVTRWLRLFEEPERLERVRALDLLGRRFFCEPGKPSLVATPEAVAPVRESAIEEWRRYEAVCVGMLGEGEEALSPAGCSNAVRRLLGLPLTPALSPVGGGEGGQS